jgi:microcystin-dependent protein
MFKKSACALVASVVLVAILKAQSSTQSATATTRVVGEITYLANRNPPIGMLRCDGATYQSRSYQKLSYVLNRKFGGTLDTFRVPKLFINVEDRVVYAMIATDGVLPLPFRVPTKPPIRIPTK